MFAVALVRGDHVAVEGVALSASVGALGVAVGVWARWFMPQGPEVQDRPVLESSDEDRAAVAAELDRGERTVVGRRVLITLLAGAVGTLGAVVLVPFRSLGPSILGDLRRTAWRSGTRLVDETGRPVRVDDLDVGGVLTVYPEGASESDRADSQTVLLRLEPSELAQGRGQAKSLDGYVAFSKVCTHAGCPVGLFQVETSELICPCHQSVFDAADGAQPTFGPATRPLPQLPLVDADGVLVAARDFDEPIGPGFWSGAQT